MYSAGASTNRITYFTQVFLCVQEVLSNFAKGLAIKIELLGHLLHAYINHANRKRKITDKNAISLSFPY